jgi:hypothetical protein
MFVVNEKFGSKELLSLLVQAVSEEGKEEMASVAEQLREEGRQEGERRGVAKGLRKALLRQLTARFGVLPEKSLARIEAAGLVELELWIERVLSAPTVDDVLDSP